MRENTQKNLPNPTTSPDTSVNPGGSEKPTSLPATTTTTSTTAQTVTMKTYGVDDVSESVFTLEKWIEEYRGNVTMRSENLLDLSLSAINKESVSVLEMQRLADALKSNTSLTELKLAYNQIGDEGTKVLSEALKVNTCLTELHLDQIDIESEGAEVLSEALKVNKALTYLALGDNEIGDEGAKKLSEALKVNTCLTCLDLKDNEIGIKGAESLSEALKVNTCLTCLDLKNNETGIKGAESLSEALKVNRCLTKLELGNSNIGNKGAEFLSEALKVNTCLTCLDLKDNEIGIKGAKKLSEALKVNTCLTCLDLKNNEIGIKGAESLSEALKVNRCLTKLELGNSNIGNKGAEFLSEALKVNDSLTDLGLADNKIGDGGAKFLSEALKVNRCLTKLDLGNSNIGNKGAEFLSEALKVNDSLTKLNLEDNEIGIKEAESLLDALKTNTTLIKLVLPDRCPPSPELNKLLKRNRDYNSAHQKINACLKSASEKLSGNEKLREDKKLSENDELPPPILRTPAQIEQNQKDIELALETALAVATQLSAAIPRYAHAKALLHEVDRQTAIMYARYGDYFSFIDLYRARFGSNPDATVSSELADILLVLLDDIYVSAELNSENNKQQLILSLLSDNKAPNAEALRSNALRQLKKGEWVHHETFAEVAGVSSGIIITFAELEAGVKEEKALLQKVKLGEEKVYVYEQLIMEPGQEARPVEFVEGVFNIETFRNYAKKVRSIQMDFVDAIARVRYKIDIGQVAPVTTTTTTNMRTVTTTSTGTQTTTEIAGEASDRRSMDVSTTGENGRIFYRSPLSAPPSESEDELGQLIERSQIPAPEKILLQNVKSGKAKLYVYQPLGMASGPELKLVEFDAGKAQSTRMDFLTRILSTLEKAAKDEFAPVTTTSTTNMRTVTTTSTGTQTTTELTGEASERRSMEVDTPGENGRIVYGSPLSAHPQEAVDVEKTDPQTIVSSCPKM